MSPGSKSHLWSFLYTANVSLLDANVLLLCAIIILKLYFFPLTLFSDRFFIDLGINYSHCGGALQLFFPFALRDLNAFNWCELKCVHTRIFQMVDRSELPLVLHLFSIFTSIALPSTRLWTPIHWTASKSRDNASPPLFWSSTFLLRSSQLFF